MKDKWKTFPCKNCLLKSKCRKNCFKFPNYTTFKHHIIENQLHDMCISCGSKYVKATHNLIASYWCYNCYSARASYTNRY